MAFRLSQLAVKLHMGRGFFVLRRLSPKSYTGEENAIIFVGISSYIAEKRDGQDAGGNTLGKTSYQSRRNVN